MKFQILIVVALSLSLLGLACTAAHSHPVGSPDGAILVTVSLPEAATAPKLFMELYRGPKPGEWLARAGGPGKTQQQISLLLPDSRGPWLLRVDSRPAARGSYAIALHRAGEALPPRFDLAPVDRYEGDDSWFQAKPLALGEVQSHTMGPSSNPRGDEDWFTLTTR